MANPLELFKTDDELIALNSKISSVDYERVHRAVERQHLKSHIWVASSGTESAKPNFIKMVALTKNAFLISAESVCRTLDICSRDIYFNTLPLFHVGGLSTLARSHTSGCTHIQFDKKWEAKTFVEQLKQNKVTLTSLVPTQIYDIVIQKLLAPSTLRFVLVGGGAMSHDLESQANALGWSTVSTYGMTETAAMMAFKYKQTESYCVFPHIESLRTDADQRLQVRSQALLSGYLFVGDVVEFKDPKVDGWFTAGDKAQVVGNTLELLGRESELVKIKGETVSLLEINQRFESFCLQNNISARTVVIARPHPRDGFELVAVSEDELGTLVLSEFNQTQLPFCRLSKTVTLEKIPTTSLGKVDIVALRRLL